MSVNIPMYLKPRDKDIMGNTNNIWNTSIFQFYGADYSDKNGLRFLNFLKCYADKNKEVKLKTILSRHTNYWSPYITAGECRDMVKFYRDALKRETIYFIEKPFKVRDGFGDTLLIDQTMVITKRPYTEETLFMKALCNDGIRGINSKEIHFFRKIMKFMDHSKGVWIS